jgi:hypothetical protein
VRDKIIKILEEITEFDKEKDNDERLNEIAEDLINYYDKNKRHHYSAISYFILYILHDQDEEYLLNNLLMLKQYFERNGKNEYVEKIEKVYDHVQLETTRKKYNEEQSRKIQEYTDTSKKELENLFNEQKERLNSLYGDIITVLGIFSAIIIAFFGGINLLGSALNNIKNVSIYRLSFIILLIGLITFNIIFMLLYVISKLLKKEISPKCKSDFCNGCKKMTISCITKYPIVFGFNLISFIFIGFIIYAYLHKI